MKIPNLFSKLLVMIVMTLTSGHLAAKDIQVAVASNFARTLADIAKQFETSTGHKVTLISGSTGKHYAQIINGAPFDIFFAADSKRPELLEKNGTALQGSRFTYALGEIVLWSPKAGYIDQQGSVLQQGDYRYLSIANPKLAPYGKAAEEILHTLGLWHRQNARLVRGENIAQAFQFVKSGNAELGFVAYSQVKQLDEAVRGSFWIVPQTLYAPIEQQAVLLKDSEASRAFMKFVCGEDAMKIIQEHGYDIPRC